jgi:membrane protease YdiL (CAAX protease family)
LAFHTRHADHLPMHDQSEGQPGDFPEPVRERHWWATDQEPEPPVPTDPARPHRRRDPGTPGAARLAAIIAIGLIIVVAILQQLAASAAVRSAGQPPGAPVGPPVAAAPLEFQLTAKFYTRIYHAIPQDQRPRIARDAITSLQRDADTPEQVLRLIMVEADLDSPEAALDRLDTLEPQLTEPLRQDAETLRLLYEDRRAELDQAHFDQLIANHGWFGRLAATYGQPRGDPQREQVVGGGLLLVFALLALILGGLLALGTGIVLLILAAIWFSSGRLRPRFNPPLPGGSVAIETVAVFIAGFIALKVFASVLAGLLGEGPAQLIALLMQWVLALLLLWPIVRGVPWRHSLALWGLHRGRGIAREIGAGIIGYIACLPLLLMGAIITLTLLAIYSIIRRAMGLPDAPPPQNPIFEIVARPGNWAMVVLLFLLASLWAPLVEEAVFRGALYRYLRSGWHWLPAGLLTALAFGVMHGYPLLMLGPVIALGFGFALLREWRGSLIASMTAHAIHNSVVLVILISILRLIG